MYKCPFCHSNNISKEGDFDKFKEKIKEILESESTDEEEMPEAIKKLFNDLLLYDMYDDEEYLKKLEERGITLICNDCGTIFDEKDEVSEENFVMPTEITKEEFYNILSDGIEEHKDELPESVLLDKENFISGLCERKNKFYKEKAHELVEDLLASIKFLNDFPIIEENDEAEEDYIS